MRRAVLTAASCSALVAGIVVDAGADAEPARPGQRRVDARCRLHCRHARDFQRGEPAAATALWAVCCRDGQRRGLAVPEPVAATLAGHGRRRPSASTARTGSSGASRT